MEECPQSVEEVKEVLEAARRKAGVPAAVNHAEDFNEEDFMDGAPPEPIVGLIPEIAEHMPCKGS